jgi:hypothetical protein
MMKYRVYVARKLWVETRELTMAKLAYKRLCQDHPWVLLNTCVSFGITPEEDVWVSCDATPAVMKGDDL